MEEFGELSFFQILSREEYLSCTRYNITILIDQVTAFIDGTICLIFCKCNLFGAGQLSILQIAERAKHLMNSEWFVIKGIQGWQRSILGKHRYIEHNLSCFR